MASRTMPNVDVVSAYFQVGHAFSQLMLMTSARVVDEAASHRDFLILIKQTTTFEEI